MWREQAELGGLFDGGTRGVVGGKEIFMVGWRPVGGGKETE